MQLLLLKTRIVFSIMGKWILLELQKWQQAKFSYLCFPETLTTLAPFVPLALWKGIIGKFMFFLPITLIITLLASLVVAYIINPVFAVSFMKKHEEKHDPYKGLKITSIIFIAIALLFYVTGAFGMGNFTIFILLLNLLHRFWLHKVIVRFQTKTSGTYRSHIKEC